ncbi:MAG TPA: cytochrome b N-terminal domain-containing protein [Desulfobacterales bacterium]|nr:cytochrome b N-terminal domain-containing protein [Desulfobacterales bacterium]
MTEAPFDATGPVPPSATTSGGFAKLLQAEVPEDAICWHRFFGALQLALLCLLFLSGALMALAYTPVPGTAYDSVDYFQFSLPLGNVVRGVHHYAWNLLLVVMGLHLLRALILGAYKAPRQLVWVSGVLFLLVMPLFIITGDLLPWDQKGYWSTQVRFSIITSIPVIGDFLVQLFRGGPLTGVVALTRLYVLHILLLPCALVLLIGLHLYFLATRGLSGPLSDNLISKPKVPLMPVIINRWMVVFIVSAIGLGIVAWQWPAALGDPADPTDAAFIPRPEWWVLFLNQLVAIFKGPFMVLGSAIIPGGLVFLLGALPFLDRSPERRPSKRMRVMVATAVVLAIITALSVMGYVEHFMRPEH